jgi:DNA polymerase-3 subunit epsilon
VVIYVGKASNLRTRVRQYFYGDTRRRIENLMRELASVDYEVCPTTLEAEVAELRLIHAHRPRHNRRSRPPRTSHFIKLTDEPFPRLSVVRSVKPNGIAYLGPFRSRGATELVVTAIWDAIPIRRCSGRAGGRLAPCAPAQLGVAFCPCDGTLSRDAYQEVVDELVRAICLQPGSLLQHLEERIATLAASLRYEEAALTRDRHRALAAALDARRVWTALAEAGTILAENGQGEKALVEWGRLTATWTDRQPLRPVPAPPQSMEVPQDVAAAEEARLIWKWLNQGQVMLHEGALALPATPIKRI